MGEEERRRGGIAGSTRTITEFCGEHKSLSRIETRATPDGGADARASSLSRYLSGVPKTIASTSTFLADPIKGSRFVASIAPCTDAEQALAHVESCRERWPDASHHCWAYRLADGEGRSHDDGEPGGSAGRPILAQIEGHDIIDAVVVVARWFGGTKLGVGGLIRAYGGCAGQALDRADAAEFVPWAELSVRFDHRFTGEVHHVVSTHGAEVLDTVYGDGVTMRLRMAQADLEDVCRALRDRTAGQAEVATLTEVSESPGA